MRTKKNESSTETAAIVDDFVKGRKLSNEGTRLVNKSKRFFTNSRKIKWESDLYIVKLETDKFKLVLDEEAIKKKLKVKSLDEFLKKQPTNSFTVLVK